MTDSTGFPASALPGAGAPTASTVVRVAAVADQVAQRLARAVTPFWIAGFVLAGPTLLVGVVGAVAWWRADGAGSAVVALLLGLGAALCWLAPAWLARRAIDTLIRLVSYLRSSPEQALRASVQARDTLVRLAASAPGANAAAPDRPLGPLGLLRGARTLRRLGALAHDEGLATAGLLRLPALLLWALAAAVALTALTVLAAAAGLADLLR